MREHEITISTDHARIIQDEVKQNIFVLLGLYYQKIKKEARKQKKKNLIHKQNETKIFHINHIWNKNI